MTWSKTLQLSPQKFDKLTSTYGQILSYARQGPDIKKYFYYFLGILFYCDHFKPVPDKYLIKNKVYRSFLVILLHVKKTSYMQL
jgi:hypothetical protein